jgi:putative OPT family oligopeptide transporter
MVNGHPPELTVRAVVLGSSVGLVMTAAITYLALYSGVAISAAIPAAVICTGFIRLVLKRATILENNIAQTLASAGEAVAVGIAYTMPALILVGVTHQLSYWQVSAVSALGGMFGVLALIPLRRTLIAESPELPYPESAAAARISRAGGEPEHSLAPMAIALLAGVAFKALVSVVQVIAGTVEGALRIAGRPVYFGSDLSLALVGVGVFVGLEFSASMLLGGLLSWLVAIPLVAPSSPAAQSQLISAAWETWSSDVRYLGLGAMVVGAAWSILGTWDVIGRGLRHAFGKLHGAGNGPVERTQRDLQMGTVLPALGLTTVGTFLLMRTATGSTSISIVCTAVVVALVLIVAAVSGYAVGLVGNSNNPCSALTICAFLIASMTFVIFQFSGDARLITSVLLISAFVCTASAVAGDTAQHLKTGALLGATPQRQQLAQLIGVVAFALVVAPIVVLLVRAYGLGGSGSGALQAPQAVLFANLADTVFGAGRVPWAMVWAGVAIGGGVIILDRLLARAASPFRLPVMPFAIGTYLPVSLTVPMFLGALLPGLLRRGCARHDPASGKEAQDRSTLLWSGLITGEALVGVATAISIWLGWRLPVRLIDSHLLSLVLFGLIVLLTLRLSLPASVRRGRPSRTAHDGR